MSKHSKPEPKKTRRAGTKRSPAKKGFFAKIKQSFLKMSKAKRITVLALLSIILVLIILVGIVLGWYLDFRRRYNNNYNEITDLDITNIEPIDDQIVNIALFGIDSRNLKSYSGNSDSIMVISVNTGTGQIKLMSIMRDTFAEIPNGTDANGKPKYSYGKINSAYAKGGPELAIKTLNHNFGLDIKEYATVNFYGMADIIDQVGGIEVEVQQKEIHPYRGLNDLISEQAQHMGIDPEKHYVEKAGKQKLNGIQAVAWARIRAVSTAQGQANDFGRTDRQRYVMEQLLNKALEMNLTEYPALASELIKYMRTSLHLEDELLPIVKAVFTKDVSFEQTRFPHYEYLINDNAIIKGGSSVYYDFEDAKATIHAFIYDDIAPEDFLKTYKPKKENWYKVNLNKKPSSSSSDLTGSDDPPEGSDEPAENEGSSSEASSSESSSTGSSSDVISSDSSPSGSSSDEVLFESSSQTSSESVSNTGSDSQEEL